MHNFQNCFILCNHGIREKGINSVLKYENSSNVQHILKSLNQELARMGRSAMTS